MINSFLFMEISMKVASDIRKHPFCMVFKIKCHVAIEVKILMISLILFIGIFESTVRLKSYSS